jgi:cyclic pyranopterin phosphate synthase
MSSLSHFDETGRVKMVDVSEKPVTIREAKASARVLLAPSTLGAIRERSNPKGDPLEIARIAGIQAAKRTSELIPLCHQIALTSVDIDIEIIEDAVTIDATARTHSQTGVEMEALTAVSVAALTIYDMCKAVQKDIVITDIQLKSKTGGKADYVRD